MGRETLGNVQDGSRNHKEFQDGSGDPREVWWTIGEVQETLGEFRGALVKVQGTLGVERRTL